jgi:hypothetical protein
MLRPDRAVTLPAAVGLVMVPDGRPWWVVEVDDVDEVDEVCVVAAPALVTPSPSTPARAVPPTMARRGVDQRHRASREGVGRLVSGSMSSRLVLTVIPLVGWSSGVLRQGPACAGQVTAICVVAVPQLGMSTVR